MSPRHLVLTGFMGAGKSTLGPVVARRLGRAFVDIDESIATTAGRSVAEIFAADGEGAFRRLEAAALRAALSTTEPAVIAVGGGALVDDELRAEALARGRVVLLTARDETLVDRTRDTSRPLLHGPDAARRVAELLRARRPAYAHAHARVSTEGVSVEESALAVERAARDDAVAVLLGERSYSIRITDRAPPVVTDLVASLHPSSVHVLTDANVGPLHAAPVVEALMARGPFSVTKVSLAAGEEHKRLAGVEAFLEHAVRAGADRETLVVGVGGGVVTDMAGLAASLLLRGVRWIAVPTTLLAMVDASIGGKTGVDLGASKNAVGTFHQPSAVVAAIEAVETQSRRDYASGLAEVVKTAAVADGAFLASIERERTAIVERRADAVRAVVTGCATLKASIVMRDEREGGLRAVLNFGHTLGHALEAAGGWRRWTHGEAVALGMVAALRVGERLGVTPPSSAQRLIELLRGLGLPVELDRSAVEEALPLVGMDKKRAGGRVRFVLMSDAGAAVLHPLSLPELAHLLRD